MTALVPSLITHKSKPKAAAKSKSGCAKVRFWIPPAGNKTPHHSPTNNRDATNAVVATESAATPTSLSVSAAQLQDPSTNTRADFEIAYKIRKATDSVAVQYLATLLCRNDIAETTCRLKQNRIDLGEVIEAAQEQVEKVKKMEKHWRMCLPSSTKDYTQMPISKPKATRESLRHFDDIRMEYAKVIAYLDVINDLKVERSLLLDDQEFMCGHTL
ncbi:hypothetical protein UA08_03724 [Talaromyces atroroseus]|uniref:Uncharacterized protein n=1 Tax=Talaromyces atroroseus TaxID=1441469 RepID=A0A225B623_TALAT|nr:hypothetical protein UA08_03724 [Talaromyces atroroseus]OKL61357.1 hypothetical protein UA08_03724 [Talaromyces atroroseus]